MKRPGRSIATAVILVSLLLLSGCNMLFPEKMDATIVINPDWTYSIEFTGILTDYFARKSLVENGRLSEEDIASLKELDKALKSDHRFRKVRNLGDGRYEVEFFETGVLQGETQLIGGGYFARVLSITPRADNYVTIEGVQIDDDAERAEAKQTMAKLGMTMDWRFRVETGAEVVTTNAQRSPWFFGLFGAYEWHITSLDDPAPLMVLKMNKTE